MATQNLESDLDLAFHLQLQEALAASIADQPSSSSKQSPSNLPKDDGVSTFAISQSEELTRLAQEYKDREQCEKEMKKEKEKLSRRIHDQMVARKILFVPSEEWMISGDCFEKPFDEGSSKNSSVSECKFKLYFKGLVSEEKIGNERVVLAGIGVAICDHQNNLIFEVRKPLEENGMSKCAAEANALIEGLNAALALELKRLIVYCDYYPLHQLVVQKWCAKQHKIKKLVNQVKCLQKKFKSCFVSLVPRNVVKFAFKFARDAIESQTQKSAESSCSKSTYESCAICLEDTNVNKIFCVNSCLHRFCFSCMQQHVEVKLHEGILPKCPHVDCKSDLDIDSCATFLTPKYLEKLRERIKETFIPLSEKVYCANPKCSALMSKSEVLEYSSRHKISVYGEMRMCIKCNCRFCISCKVPWHDHLSCSAYKRLNPNPPMEESKLKFLATIKNWRQCKKCSLMIELLEGCYHITCRCGYEFCYLCGAEWKNKKSTCSCPLWDEEHIWNDEDLESVEEDEEEEEEEYTDSDSNDYNYYL